MAELASGTVVKILAPGTVKTLWLKEGPTGPTGLKGDTGDTGATGAPGTTIVSIARTAGDGSSGSTDTYTITYSDATTSTFQVYNGTDGTGTGDVVGPAGATDNRVVLFDGISGKLLKDSGVTLGTAATEDTGFGAGQVPVLGATPGTPDGTKFLRDDGTWQTPAGGGGSTLLAYTARNNPTSTTYATTSTTVVDVDAANLAVTFTVPASGTVEVILSSFAVASTAANLGYWCLRNGSTNVVGTERAVIQSLSPVHVTPRIRVSGLTPGASVTYKWGYRAAGAGGTSIAFGGSSNEFTAVNYGPATMEVWSA